MSHPGNLLSSSGDKGDCDGQDAWSSAFPPNNDRPFDDHSFGRMDRPVRPFPFENPLDGTDTHALPSLPHESFAVPNISDDLFVLDHALLPPRSDASRSRDYAAFFTRDGESFKNVEFNTSSKPHGLYRDVLLGELTPYVGLRARMTQIPINRWTVLLMLVLARLVILFQSLNTNLASAQDQALSACSHVEEIGSAMVSMPYYISVGVNELVAMGITDSVRGLLKVLMMILSGMLEMLTFFTERTYGTIACVAASFIKGLIGLATAAVEGLTQGIDADLAILVGDLSDAVADVGKGLVQASEALAKLPFVDIDLPNLDSVDIAVDRLKNATFINATATVATITTLTNFDNKIPNFTDTIADVQAVIRIPFTTVETLLNDSLGNWSVGPFVFPKGSKQTLTFCSGNDTITDLFGVLFKTVRTAKIVAVSGLLLIGLLAAALMAWWEFQRYKRTVEKSRVLLNREPMDIAYIVGRPLTAGAGLWISQKVSSDPDRQILTRWVVAYATTSTALFVLSLAAAGAFSILCQFLIMRAVQIEAPGLGQEVGTFVTTAMDALEGSSTMWANKSNQALVSLQNDVNDKILMHLQNATDAVVSLINTFENDTTTLLKDFYGNNSMGVSADNFTEDLVSCVIFDTLIRVRSGITWINEEAHITMPEFPADVFSLGATGNSDNSSFSALLTHSGMQAATDITSAVNKVVVILKSDIVLEGLISLVLFLVYITYVFFAMAQAALRMCCMKQRLPKDVEKGGYVMEDLQALQNNIHDEARVPGPIRLPSIAPSHQTPKLDVNRQACLLSVMQEDPIAATRRTAEYVAAKGAPEENEDPFGDNTYAIRDEETEDPTGILRNSGRTAVDSGPRNRQAWVEDPGE